MNHENSEEPTRPAPHTPVHSEPSITTADNLRSILLTVGILLLAPLIAIFLTAFVIQSYRVDGISMQATLNNNDRLIVDKLPRSWARLTHKTYVPNRGDIIIFNQNLPGYVDEKQLVKRVVGLPGDRVVVKNGSITIYNSAHPNGFNPDTSLGYHLNSPVTTAPQPINIKLNSDQIFVCGDNRNNSEDSRYFGPVNVRNIDGKLVLRILPLSKVQNF
jgi:signal peptidase I